MSRNKGTGSFSRKKRCLSPLQNSTSHLCRISVLGSGKVREKDPCYQQAVKLGTALAQEGFSVYHGGYRGVMEAVAKGCRLAGGYNVGVTMTKKGTGRFLGTGSFSQKKRCLSPFKKSACPLNAEIRMSSWKSRLFKLIEVGEAYVFLDGATGTLAELFVVLEMTNRGLLKKPIIILGRKLGLFLRTLKKDPHFDLPRTLHFATSTSKAIKLLKRSGLQRKA
ncbi:MAG: hypothetical protein A2351_04680 [Omnitrophica bacterium RIFOXYB12_FULL_50_7]|nr:MAG: hypothetical protein A2351_04680 [Omnitrophica bacterium RIFOXYB12_FULL_50_7]